MVAMFYDIETCTKLYSAATGLELEQRELIVAGERAWNLQKAINVREGFDRKDDSFPNVWFEPLGSEHKKLYLTDYAGTKRLLRDDMCRLLEDYYEERGWEVRRGIPTREKLADLGLESIITDLERLGIPIG
jgi:aldehyde:ferredoxin oxidoreductase